MRALSKGQIHQHFISVITTNTRRREVVYIPVLFAKLPDSEGVIRSPCAVYYFR